MIAAKRKKISKARLVLIAILVLPGSFTQDFSAKAATIPSSITATGVGVSSAFETEGLSLNGRTFVPLRAVSEHLGAKVSWNAPERMTEVRYGGTLIAFSVNSNRVRMGNRSVSLDTAPRIVDNRLYVPIKPFVRQFGGTLAWNAKTQQTIYTLGGRTVRINFAPRIYAPKITDSRIQALTQAADRIADPSEYAQVRREFRPYFTDRYLNKVIRSGGTGGSKEPFTGKAELIEYDGQPVIRQGGFQDDAGGLFVDRMLRLVYENGKWVIEEVSFRSWMP